MSWFPGAKLSWKSSSFIKTQSRWEEEMKRWDEVSLFCVSRNTYSVCLTLSSYRSSPSLSNFKHSCKHLLVSHLWICVGKCHPFLFRLGVDKTSTCYLRTVISSVAMHHSSSQDEGLGRWKADTLTLWRGNPLWRKDLQGRNVQPWFIQVVSQVLSKQTSHAE